LIPEATVGPPPGTEVLPELTPLGRPDPKGAGAIGGTTGGDVMLEELKESSPVLLFELLLFPLDPPVIIAGFGSGGLLASTLVAGAICFGSAG